MNAQIKISYTGKTPKQLQTEWTKFVTVTVPKIVGRELVNFFKDRFRFGGWVDGSFKKWEDRDPDTDEGRAVLLKTKRLRDSIRVIESGTAYVIVGTDTPYAQAHNEGFKGAVSINSFTRTKKGKFKTKFSNIKTRKTRTRTIKIKVGETIVKAHIRNMDIPQRQFMGASDFIFKRINLVVEAEAKRIFG